MDLQEGKLFIKDELINDLIKVGQILFPVIRISLHHDAIPLDPFHELKGTGSYKRFGTEIFPKLFHCFFGNRYDIPGGQLHHERVIRSFECDFQSIIVRGLDLIHQFVFLEVIGFVSRFQNPVDGICGCMGIILGSIMELHAFSNRDDIDFPLLFNLRQGSG